MINQHQSDLSICVSEQEKALQKRPPDNFELAKLSKEEMHSLIHELQVHQISNWRCKMTSYAGRELDLEATRVRDIY